MPLIELGKAGEVIGWIENRGPRCHISEIRNSVDKRYLRLV